MGYVMCLYLVLAGILYLTQAQSFYIRKEFINGDLKFTWTNVSTNRNDVYIRNDGIRGLWMLIYDDTYTLKDVWRYKSVTIKVREYNTTDFQSFQDYTVTYTVSQIDAQEGESKNLTWTAPAFPRYSPYKIYHFHDSTNETVIQVMQDGATTRKPLKHIYHTRPYNSTNIIFEVRNITLMDAGYYGGGTTPRDARSRPGIIFVVTGKPTKPNITATMETIENSNVTLTCASKSTFRPSYYSKNVSLTYSWYRNNTVMNSETRITLRIPRISRDERFNKYSCRSKENIESEKSDEIKINVLYGPNRLILRPQLPVNQTLSVKDGNYIGPHHCSADCNPPCSIQWMYKLSNGTIGDAESDGETLLQQRVFKDKAEFRCVAKSTLGITSLAQLKLHIMYLSELIFSVNGKKQEFADIKEGESLSLACRVEAKPTPSLSISNVQMKILKSQASNAVDVSIPEVKCSDTDIYTCTGSLAGFVSMRKEVTIGVLCEPRIDAKPWFKTHYGTKSGIGVKVTVNTAIISYPKPSKYLISWSGPTSSNIGNEIEERERRSVNYKHWIVSTIPVEDVIYYGHYTMTYNGNIISTITISDEGQISGFANDDDFFFNFASLTKTSPSVTFCKPKPPLNFTGYSYSSGYINLTWISDFNGGPEQFFILSRKAEYGWKEVANITDPGEGGMGYYDPGHLNPGHEYWYRLESCNRINCSFRPVEVKVTVLECKSGYFLSGNNPNEHYRNSSDCRPCGNCRDNLPCNTTTGHCSEGCQINFQPPYCKELITPNQSNTLQTTTIALTIICTVLLVTIAIIAGVAFRRRLKRRLESTPSQSENEANTPMNATEGQQQPEDTYDYPLNEYEKINVATNDHTYTTPEQQQSEDTYECPLNEYENINVATDGHTYDKVA